MSAIILTSSGIYAMTWKIECKMFWENGSDENQGIIAGHGHMLDAKELGLENAGQDDPADLPLESCGACASSFQDAHFSAT